MGASLRVSGHGTAKTQAASERGVCEIGPGASARSGELRQALESVAKTGLVVIGSSLGGHTGNNSHYALDVAITGSYRADRGVVRVDELEGACAGATHVVRQCATLQLRPAIVSLPTRSQPVT